jgi:hypothetical protein
LIFLVHIFADCPIELETLANEEITEDLMQVRVVGLIFELKIDGEFTGQPFAQDFSRSGHLLFHDALWQLRFLATAESQGRDGIALALVRKGVL